MRRLLARALATILPATAALAQTVWSVEGDTGSNNLLSVIAQAATGDVLQFVQGTGTFPPFVLTKGLTLLGPAPVLRPTVHSPQSRLSIPAGQRARLHEIYFGGPAGQEVELDGAIALEGCRFRSLAGRLPGPTRTVTITGGTVIARDCVVFGQPGGGGLTVQGGVVSLANCFLAGAAATSAAVGLVGSSPALAVDGGVVVAADLVVTGGEAACPTGTGVQLPPSPGIRVTGSGMLHLVDSDVTGGSGLPSASGSCQLPGAAALSGPADLRYARCVLQGGAGLPNGSPVLGGAQPVPALVGLGIDFGWRLGQPTTATASAGSSGQLLALFGSFDRTPVTLPGVVGPVFGAAGPTFVLATGAPAPAMELMHTVTLPSTPALQFTEIWLQAIQLDGATAYASPVVGGIVR